MIISWLLWNVLLVMFDQSLSRKLEVNWDAEGKGYHRDIMLTMQGPPATDLKDKCNVCLVFNLPQGIYVDIYQMANLQEFGGPQVYSRDEIDLEKAAHNSQSHLVYMYGTMEVQRNVFQKSFSVPMFQNQQLEADMSFPLHLRYHKPSAVRDLINVKLEKPQVLVRCKEGVFDTVSEKSAPCDASGSTYCIWNIPITEFDNEQLIFSIPVGNKKDRVSVVMGTLVVTITSCLYLMYAIYNKILPKESSKIKTS